MRHLRHPQRICAWRCATHAITSTHCSPPALKVIAGCLATARADRDTRYAGERRGKLLRMEKERPDLLSDRYQARGAYLEDRLLVMVFYVFSIGTFIGGVKRRENAKILQFRAGNA